MFPHALLPALPNRLALIQVAASRGACQAAHQAVFELAARLSLAGPLRVVDAGGLFDLYSLARALRQLSDSPLTLDRSLAALRLSRAATGEALLAALSRLPAVPIPTLAVDLLAPFTAAAAPPAEAYQLLSACVAHLRRLNRAAPVLVTGQAPAAPTLAQQAQLRLLRGAAACILEVRRENTL